MRKLIIGGVAVLTVGVTCVGVSAGFMPASAPKQEMHTAGERVLSSSSRQAEVKSVVSMERPAVTQTPSAQALRQVSHTVTELSDRVVHWQTNVTSRTAALAKHEQQLTRSLVQLSNKINYLQREVNAMLQLMQAPQSPQHKTTTETAASPRASSSASLALISSWWQSAQKQVISWRNYLIMRHGKHNLMMASISLALVIFLLSFLVFPTSKKGEASGAAAETDAGEYDFLGSPEGIPAKLDLARAYFAMQEYEPMREVLTEVMVDGSEEQQRAAKHMMDKIPSES